MTVRQILESKGRAVETISPDVAVSDAVAILSERRIGALVALSEGGRVAGIGFHVGPGEILGSGVGEAVFRIFAAGEGARLTLTTAAAERQDRPMTPPAPRQAAPGAPGLAELGIEPAETV